MPFVLKSYRNVAIETKSLLRHVLPSEGSDGDDIFVLKSFSSHISLATSTGEALIWLVSLVNGFSLQKMRELINFRHSRH